MRRAARIDGNHREVVQAFIAAGCTVADTSGVGGGFPDLIVAKDRINLLVEVKDGSKPPSARQLTPDQVKFHTRWAGQIDVVQSVGEAIALVSSLTKQEKEKTP